MNGFPPLPSSSHRVKLAVKAVFNLGPPPNQKSPITVSLLQSLLGILPVGLEGSLYRAMLALGFFGGLRGAEYAAVSIASSWVFPTLDAVSFVYSAAGPVLHYSVPSSKTRIHGLSIDVGYSGTFLCAPCLLLSIFLPDPLFLAFIQSPLSFPYSLMSLFPSFNLTPPLRP